MSANPSHHCWNNDIKVKVLGLIAGGLLLVDGLTNQNIIFMLIVELVSKEALPKRYLRSTRLSMGHV